MPVVLRIGPYVFFFYAEEGNEPPHIHVRRDTAEMKIWLTNFRTAKVSGFANHEQRRIVTLVIENRELLMEAWNDFFTRRKGR
jgi:hypothetical protein